MPAGPVTLTDREPSHLPVVRWCPECRGLQAQGPECVHCGPSSVALVPLVRGLASLDVASERGLVRYHGDRSTALGGLVLLLLLPLAAATALFAELPLLPPLLMALCLIGIPALAFVDAYRAGIAAHAGSADMPPVAPPALSDGRTASRRGVRLQGMATRVRDSLHAPVSARTSLAYRLDVRAGQDADLIAWCTRGVDFMLTCGDGSQMLITGVVEVVSHEYRTTFPCRNAALRMNGTDLLPALFTEGGWACEITIHEGDAVEAYGPCSDELQVNPLGATYRNSGYISILHGVPGDPVIIRLLNVPVSVPD